MYFVNRYIATGDSSSTPSFLFRASGQVIYNIVKETAVVVWTVLEPIVFELPTDDLWLRTAAGFEAMWNIIHCIGATDGRHIRIQVIFAHLLLDFLSFS